MIKEVTACGIPYLDFGQNNYSEGMSAVVFAPKDINPLKVGDIEGFFLHPTLEPDSSDIWALKGTPEQYKKFCKSAIVSESTKIAFRNGYPDKDDTDAWDKIHKEIDRLVANFRPWYQPYIDENGKYIISEKLLGYIQSLK